MAEKISEKLQKNRKKDHSSHKVAQFAASVPEQKLKELKVPGNLVPHLQNLPSVCQNDFISVKV